MKKLKMILTTLALVLMLGSFGFLAGCAYRCTCPFERNLRTIPILLSLEASATNRVWSVNDFSELDLERVEDHGRDIFYPLRALSIVLSRADNVVAAMEGLSERKDIQFVGTPPYSRDSLSSIILHISKGQILSSFRTITEQDFPEISAPYIRVTDFRFIDSGFNHIRIDFNEMPGELKFLLRERLAEREDIEQITWSNLMSGGPPCFWCAWRQRTPRR